VTAIQQPVQISCSVPDTEKVEEMLRCFFSPFAKPLPNKDKGYLSTSCSQGKGKKDTRRTEVFLPVSFSISLFIYSSDGTGEGQQWCFK